MNIFGEIIYGYSRAQAIEDGTLVDVSTTAKEAGFNCPVALTATAWADCVAWNDIDSQRKTYQDESGRLWDVLWLARQAAQRAQSDHLQFELYRIPREGRGITSRRTRLEMSIGPGDTGEAVITVMLPGEN